MDSIIRKHSAKKQKKNYFTKETEQAIVRYNKKKISKHVVIYIKRKSIILFLSLPKI